MGELIGQSLEEGLAYVPAEEFERALSIPDQYLRATLFATLARINALYMIARAGSGHIGSSFSSLDLLAWLHLKEMQPNDIFFSSKGHDAPGYYAAMIGLNRLPFDQIHQLRRQQGLPGHPDIHIPVCVTNTGSLGMGISKAKGMLFARKLQGKTGNIYVLTGDGELQEGQIWESLVTAANEKLYQLIVIVDHNKLQSDTFVHLTSDLGDLNAKFESFGWHVARCDGHDLKALDQVFESFKQVTDKPKILIADTIKGRGVSFMEHTSFDSDVATYRFHSGAPDQVSYTNALQELLDQANNEFAIAKQSPLALTFIAAPARATPVANPQRLVQAYSRALIEQAERNPNIVALDADLMLDTGLIPFKNTFPERFIECGIAEQDMVSQAGGMALQGLMPIVHSFACFLSARPNEHIYNNATECTRIMYVGSLAGVVPGGPGHSHQAVRDIAALSAIAGLEMIEPCCEDEVKLAVDYCINEAKRATYLRLVSIPCDIPYQLPKHYTLEAGKGVTLRDGKEAVIIGYGPVLITQAWHAAERLMTQGISVKLINLPWLNQINLDWLLANIANHSLLITLDNHQLAGGQGQQIAAALGATDYRLPIISLGLSSIPKHGTNDEVLRAHGLDAMSIEQVIIDALNRFNKQSLAV